MTSNELNEMVTYLASDELSGRDIGSEGIEKAASYIEDKFKAFGIKPYYTTYKDNFKVGDVNAFNIVGFLEGIDQN